MNTAIQLPTLAEGERYLGAFGDAAGNIHHTILLPGDNDDATWKEQKDWAKSIGGELPTRAELVTAYETMPEEFKKDWYWSSAEHVAYPGYAWVQDFNYGYQSYLHTSSTSPEPARSADCPFSHSFISKG